MNIEEQSQRLIEPAAEQPSPVGRDVEVRVYIERIVFALCAGIAFAIVFAQLAKTRENVLVATGLGLVTPWLMYSLAQWFFGVGGFRRPARTDEPAWSWGLFAFESLRFIGIAFLALSLGGAVNIVRSCN